MLNKVVYFQTPTVCLGPLLDAGENANVASKWVVLDTFKAFSGALSALILLASL